MHEEIILLFRVKEYSLALTKEMLFTESKEKKVIDFADAKKVFAHKDAKMHEGIILLFRVKDYSLALTKEMLFTESKEKKVIDFADAKKFSHTKTRRCTKG